MSKEIMMAIIKYHQLSFIEAFFAERANVLQAALQYVEQGAMSPSSLFPNRTPNDNARAAEPFSANQMHATLQGQGLQEQSDDSICHGQGAPSPFGPSRHLQQSPRSTQANNAVTIPAHLIKKSVRANFQNSATSRKQKHLKTDHSPEDRGAPNTLLN